MRAFGRVLASGRVLRHAAPLAALLALAAPGEASATDRLDLWVEAGGGADSNPSRAPGATAAAHPFASLLGRVRLRLEGESTEGTLSVTEAGRLYQHRRGADALASRVEVAGRAGLGGGLSAAVTGAASDYTEREGLLDRHALRGEGSLTLRRGALQGGLAGGWSLFAPRETSLPPETSLRRFRSAGPEGWLRGGWSPADGHQLSASLGYALAAFPGWPTAGEPTRSDRALHLSAEWAWRGPALVSAGWAFTQNGSDVTGGDFTRHRLSASAALRLPLQLTLVARLALQWTHYPDPLFLTAALRLAEGQEALDQLEARLTRTVSGPVEASLSLAWYRAQGGAGVPAYQRTVATLALGWRSRAASP